MPLTYLRRMRWFEVTTFGDLFQWISSTSANIMPKNKAVTQKQTKVVRKPKKKKIKLTVRPGSKVKYNEGKYRVLTSYID